MKIKLFATATIGLILFSCSPKVAQPVATEAPLSPELAAGKMLYENNCGKCHKLYNAKDFSSENWKPILAKMQKKAKISDEDREKIYAYLTK